MITNKQKIMNKILQLSFAFYLLSQFGQLSAQVTDDSDSSYSPFKFGILMGYSFANMEGYELRNENGSPIKEFSDGYLNNYFAGGNLTYTFYNGIKNNHNIIIDTYFEYHERNFTDIQQNGVIINNKLVKGTMERDYSLSFLFISVRALYNVNFAKKHIGFLIGPYFSYTIFHDYSISEQRNIYNSSVIDKSGEVETGEIQHFIKTDIGLFIGMNFIINFNYFDLVPFVAIKRIGDEAIVDLSTTFFYNFGFEVRL